MKKFAFIDTTGSIQYTAVPSDDAAFTSGDYYNSLLCQEFDYSMQDAVAIATLYWKEGWRTRPDKPFPIFVWDNELEQWVDPRTLQDFKTAQWAKVKQARALAESAGFTYDGSVFDSDAQSQARINGAVTLALIAKQANQPYTITWTLKDGTLRTLSADEMIAVGLALGTHVQTGFNKGQQLQQQINAATTKEEIEAITW